MVQIGSSYFAMLIFFICAELLVLTNIMQPLFHRYIGHLMRENTNFMVAAIFYFVYVAGVYWFATRAGIRSDSYLVALISGCFLGLLAFGTYELTNYLIIKDWNIKLVYIDTCWGITISGTMAVVGYQIHKWLE